VITRAKPDGCLHAIHADPVARTGMLYGRPNFLLSCASNGLQQHIAPTHYRIARLAVRTDAVHQQDTQFELWS
jgi:hypothetical protein